ncbi:MAG: 50S ribosomal protein L4 [Desulfurivibrionaceae bacterium]|jgi:large subunit ribosomal protein L4|nr:50S ribosomal protein L4 [Pseudomonadota bacterium]MBU4407437.1 50S ribosomal protein L4 [Pseudomonadota bacterium]MDP2002186.1 50S ribosomal protein L4 [Desulfurivibrionaceae bacterium]
MAVTEIFNVENVKVGDLELNDNLFAVPVNPHIIHEIVRMQRAARRAGTACTKTRTEVRGGGKKPWKQKGTGRARSGTRTSPLWRGGGVVFGPKPRDYSFKLPKKVKKLGLRMALSSRFSDKLMLVLDNFKIEEIKTKKFIGVMNALKIDNALIVIPERDDHLERSSRNVQGFKVIPTAGLNVYDILLHKHIVLLQPCIGQLEERLLS